MWQWSKILAMMSFFNLPADGLNKVSVYYETLCYDSMEFIVNQLYPNFPHFQSSIDIELIPYGKAVHNLVGAKWQFRCQHGPNECKLNKYHACYLDLFKNSTDQVNFVHCAMAKRSRKYLENMETCLNEDDWNALTKCANQHSDQGDLLLAKNGDKTHNLNPKLSFVPTIVYDDVYNDYFQRKSLVDFTSVVCSKMADQPDICKGRPVYRDPAE